MVLVLDHIRLLIAVSVLVWLMYMVLRFSRHQVIRCIHAIIVGSAISYFFATLLADALRVSGANQSQAGWYLLLGSLSAIFVVVMYLTSGEESSVQYGVRVPGSAR